MKHLVPKQIKAHGLTGEQLEITSSGISKVIRNYTKESGVRQLEREIGNICRKVAKEILTTTATSIVLTQRNLKKFLGREKYTYQKANSSDDVGIVRGLAWTSVGGDTLQVEVNVMPGKGNWKLTGQMGDVMKESAQAGISYVRSISKEYSIPEDFFEKHDIHLHIPEGAVPKDGPSAGITMATALLSAITGIKVYANVAMTGEVTLRGRVLAVGGLKEKILAAKSAGITKVLLPKENKEAIKEMSGEITKGLEIILVETMDDVLREVLVK
jgi:ATP-dependent Lon protease